MRSTYAAGSARALQALAVALLAGALALLALAGCSAGGKAGEDSPRMAQAAVASFGDGTEQGQLVRAELSFDAPVVAAGDVLTDLDVQLNGAPCDAGAVAVAAEVRDGRLVVELSPVPGAGGVNSAKYFALYEGQLSVAPRGPAGALPHVVRADDAGVCAVMDAPARFSVPSGVEVSGVQAQAGDAAAGTCARVSFDVESPAALRYITWVALSLDGPVARNAYGTCDFTDGDVKAGALACVHNHDFARESAGSCAARIAEAVQATWPGDVIASADGTRVTVVAARPQDGQVLDVALFEGRYGDAA